MNTKLVAIIAIAAFASFGLLYESADAALANGVTFVVSEDGTGLVITTTGNATSALYPNSGFALIAADSDVNGVKTYTGLTLGDEPRIRSILEGTTYNEWILLAESPSFTAGKVFDLVQIESSQLGDAINFSGVDSSVSVDVSGIAVSISNGSGSHPSTPSAISYVTLTHTNGETRGQSFTTNSSFTGLQLSEAADHLSFTLSNVLAGVTVTVSDSTGSVISGVQSGTNITYQAEGLTTYSFFWTIDGVNSGTYSHTMGETQAQIDARNLVSAQAENDAANIVSKSSTSVMKQSVGSNTSVTIHAFGGITMVNDTFNGLASLGTYDFTVSTTIGTQTVTKTVTVTLVYNNAENLAQAQADRDAVTHSFTSNSVTFSNIASSVTVTFGVSTMSDGETVSGLTEESSYTYTVSATVGTQTSSTNTISFTTPVSQGTVDSRNLADAEAERDAVTHNARNAFNGASVVTFSNIGTNTIVTFEGSTVSENFNYGVTGLQDYTYNVSTTISGQTATSTVSFTAVLSSTQAQAQAEADLASIVITFSPDATTATLSNISDTITSLYSGVNLVELTITNGVSIATGLTEQTSYQVTVIGQLGIQVSKYFTTPQSDLNRQADFDAAELAAQAELVKVTLTATQGIGFTVSNTGSAIVTFNGEVLQDGQAVATGAGSFTVQVEVTVTIGTQSSTKSTEITVIVDEEKKKRKFIPSYPTNIVGININGMDINVDRHDIMLETPVKSFGLTTIQVSLDDPEGDMIGLRVYIEQPDFHDTGYSKANVYGAEIYVTGKHSEMTGYTIDNIETNDKNDFYWVSQDKDFNNLGQILSAEVLSVKLIERDVKTSNLIEGNFDVNKVVEIKMLNTFDMEGATIYVLANDRDSNMQMFKIYNALTVEHIGSQGFEDMNEGGCGKTGNHNNWTACVINPYTYVR